MSQFTPPVHPEPSGSGHRKPRRLAGRGRQIATAAALTAAVAVGAGLVYWAWPSGSSHPPATPVSSASAARGASSDPLTGARPPAAGRTDPSTTATSVAQRALAAWDAHKSGAITGPGGAVTAVLRIPVLGGNWAEPIYDGIDTNAVASPAATRALAAGIGHFDGTETPDETGNYALAGHRSGVSTPPLRDIDAIRIGSEIEVTTPTTVTHAGSRVATTRRPATYVYVVDSVTTVMPTDIAVIDQVPGHPGAAASRPELTLITCWPADGHSRRVVVVAHQTSMSGGI